MDFARHLVTHNNIITYDLCQLQAALLTRRYEIFSVLTFGREMKQRESNPIKFHLAKESLRATNSLMLEFN